MVSQTPILPTNSPPFAITNYEDYCLSDSYSQTSGSCLSSFQPVSPRFNQSHLLVSHHLSHLADSNSKTCFNLSHLVDAFHASLLQEHLGA